MKFCLNINLKLFDINSNEDWWNLSLLFDDASLSNFMIDNQYAKYIYFIRDNNDIIGFVYLLQYKDTDILNLEYGINEKYLNDDYIYTILTLIRDKIKGINNQKELENATIVSSIIKIEDRYNKIAKKFGNKIYEDSCSNYYEVNPNCENLAGEKKKILKYFNQQKQI